MKVWEVIEALQKFDKDLEVCTHDNEYGVERANRVESLIMTYQGYDVEEDQEVVVIES